MPIATGITFCGEPLTKMLDADWWGMDEISWPGQSRFPARLPGQALGGEIRTMKAVRFVIQKLVGSRQ